MFITITLTTPVGSSVGPFDLFSNADSYAVAFDTNIPLSTLLSGYTIELPMGATIVRVQSVGVCTNYIDLPVDCTTTTTTTVAPTTTTTTTIVDDCNCITVSVLDTQLTSGGQDLYYILNSCSGGNIDINLNNTPGTEIGDSTYFGLCSSGPIIDLFKYGSEGSEFEGIEGMNITTNETPCSINNDCVPVTPTTTTTTTAPTTTTTTTTIAPTTTTTTTEAPFTFNSVLSVDDCSDQEGIATTIVAINQDDVIVGNQLQSTSGGSITDLGIGFYRMSNNLIDGNTYQIGNIQSSTYVVQVGNNGVISQITNCF
jgi:hypothetical protein